MCLLYAAVLLLLLLASAVSSAAVDSPAALHLIFAVEMASGRASVVAANPVPHGSSSSAPPILLEAILNHSVFAVVDEGATSRPLLVARRHLGNTGMHHFDYSDLQQPEQPHLNGKVLRADESTTVRYHSVSAPIHARQVHLFRRDGASSSSPHPMATWSVSDRHFSAAAGSQQSSSTIVNSTTIQYVNIDTQPTVVFVSSGYTNASLFDADVAVALRTLSDSSATAAINSAPWPRYYSLLNIYSVFEPSATAGASVAVGPGFDCAAVIGSPPTPAPASSSSTVPDSSTAVPVGCTPYSTENNLRCAFGTPQPRLLGCDYVRVLTLASYAPPADVIVVLVNSEEYGGSASPGLAVVSTASDLPFILIHELNHAVSGLGDEYSYGFTEDATALYQLPNCAAAPAPDLLPWAPWIALGGADAVPSLGCSFNNFYRPTADDCLMRLKIDHMCDVCRAQVTIDITTRLNNDNNSSTIIDFASPRCPPSGFSASLGATDAITLFINHIFATLNSNVSVTWTIPQATGTPEVVLGVPSVVVEGGGLPLGISVITVVVVDDTDYLLTSTKVSQPRQQTASFTINRLPGSADNANCTEVLCTSTTGVTNTYCGTCTSPDGCPPVAVTMPREYLPPPTETLYHSETTVWAVAATITIGGAVITTATLLVLSILRRSRPVEVLVLRPVYRALGVATALLNVAGFAVSCAFIIGLVYCFRKLYLLGPDFFISSFVFASCAYVAAVFALCALLCRLVPVLIVSGAVSLFVGVGVFVISAIGFWLLFNIGTVQAIAWLRSVWQLRVASHPDWICAVQRYLDCSGFDAACFPAPSSWCPANCDVQNRNTNACLEAIQGYVWDPLSVLVIIGVVAAFISTIGGGVTVAYGFAIAHQRRSFKGRRSYRHDPRPPVDPLTDAERDAVRDEFLKVAHQQHTEDDQGRPTLDGRALRHFISAVFNGECTADDEEAILLATSNHADRGLTLDELLGVYFPHRDVRSDGPDPRLLSEDEAESAKDAGDLARMQLQKAEAFMSASGALSPEQISRLHRSWVRNNGNNPMNSAKFLAMLRKASRVHASSEEAAMCRGLTNYDLEGLRCAWVRLHPAVEGDLSDEEMTAFYKATHGGDAFVSQEHYVRWRSMLDVRHRGGVGWAEFCYPFAQRALLRLAESQLASIGNLYDSLILEYPTKLVTREQAAAEYGPSIPGRCFLPHEAAVPIARVLAATIPPPVHHAAQQDDSSLPIDLALLEERPRGA